MALRLHFTPDMHIDGNETPSSAQAKHARALEEYDLVILGGEQDRRLRLGHLPAEGSALR